jgi:hypothetical protein
MHVNQTGHDDQPARYIDDFCAVNRQIASDARNPIAIDQQVEYAVTAVGRIDDATALE